MRNAKLVQLNEAPDLGEIVFTNSGNGVHLIWLIQYNKYNRMVHNPETNQSNLK